MAQRIDIHNRSIAGRKLQIKTWKLPAQEQKSLLRFIEELELGKVNKGRKISESRQCKYLDVLRLPLEFFGKPATRLRLPDLETFEKAISSGQLQSNRKSPYAHSSKVDIRRALKVYLRWRLGATKASTLVGWFDTRHVNKTPDYLKESDIDALLKACKSAEERFLVAVLFDTGARATEFHNIRYEDIQLPREGSSYAKITLKEEYSKTKGRMVSLYWKHSLDALRDYLRQREIEGIRADEPVFKRAYTAARLFLHRLGVRVLNRSIHYHLFRHSSATYYASKLNRQQLCIRYGWAFSSRMPDVYIARSGVDMEELDKKFTGTEVEVLKGSLARMEQETQLKGERILHLEQDIATLQQNLASVAAILKLEPTRQEIEARLRGRAGGGNNANASKPAS